MKIFKIILLFLIVILFITNIVCADKWVNTNITNGLDKISATASKPTIYNDNGTWKLISGSSSGTFTGFYWNNSSWIGDASIVNGLVDIGAYSTPTVYNDSGTWKLISGEIDGEFVGYYWNNSTWINDVSIVNGIGDIGALSTSTVYNDSGTWKLISGEETGKFTGFYWNNSSWISDASIVNGLVDIGVYSTPTVYNDSGTWKLISGETAGEFVGYYWNNSSWIGDASIVNGLYDAGDWSAPDVYNDNGRLKLISGLHSAYFNGFIYNHMPTIPTTISESDYHLNQSITVQWLNSTDADGDVISYHIKVGTTSGGADILNETISENESSSFNINQFETYYWSVRSNDTYEVSDWSTEDIFSVINSAPVITNTTLSPDPPATEDDLTANNDTATDGDEDAVTLYYRWYKNNVLQSDLTTSIVNSSNTSNGELWKVGIIPNDGYENGTEVQSQTVEIESLNSAPTLTGINIDKSYPLKRYINFTVTSENASDPNNDPRKLEVGSAPGLSDIGIGDYFSNGNESNITIAMPFYDGNSHILYIRLNDSNLTSQEYTLIIESDITKPVVNSESVSPATGIQGTPFGIIINTTSINSTISTVTVNILRPDATSANWTLSNTVNDTWYHSYTGTTDIGTYSVNYFTITDASGNIKTATSSLSAIITAAVTGGGGGGGGGTTIIQTGNITDLTMTPPRLDTYVLYGGFGEDRTLKYRFIANREVESCLIDSTEGYSDTATCEIIDGYIIDVHLTINDSKGYSGTLTVRDSGDFVATSGLIVRVIDIGAYIKIINIPVGEALANPLNIFFASENGVLIGIRAWLIGAIIGLLGLSLFKSNIFE